MADVSPFLSTDRTGELVSSKGLWFVREGQRAVLETMQLDIGIGNNHGVLLDAVHDFAIHQRISLWVLKNLGKARLVEFETSHE